MPSIDVISAVGLSGHKRETYTALAPAITVSTIDARLDSSSNNVIATLAAPGTAMLGKFISIVADDVSNTTSVAFTDPSGAVVGTFSAVGDCLCLMGSTATDWVVFATPSGGIA